MLAQSCKHGTHHHTLASNATPPGVTADPVVTEQPFADGHFAGNTRLTKSSPRQFGHAFGRQGGPCPTSLAMPPRRRLYHEMAPPRESEQALAQAG